ncbi:MAG: amidohydrolase, partial [Acidobacteriota bacterium]
MIMADGDVPRLLVLLTMFVAMSPLWACGPRVEPADLVLRHGKIVTVDPDSPQAQALAVRGDRLIAVGGDDTIEPYTGPNTEVIDLDGKLAVPGFIEGHGHFMWLGDTKMQLDLTGAESWEEIVSRVAGAVARAEPGEWIRGFGWHQVKWKELPKANVQGFPFHGALSAVSPNHPVILKHASGHGTFANAKAMELAGVTRNTPNPAGGEILKDSSGNPVGMFLENAARLVEPGASAEGASLLDLIDTFPGGEAAARRRAELAAGEAVSKGITTFQDAGASFETIEVFKKLVEEGKLPLRLWVMISAPNQELAQELPHYKIVGMGGHHLTVRSIKKVLDG